jgi:hypothetical protein
MKFNPRPEIKSLNELFNTIFMPEYKRDAMLFDLPSNSQILGHIAYEAGIQAIKYPSRLTGKICLAIFPLNFEKSESYVEISDEAPQEIERKKT